MNKIYDFDEIERIQQRQKKIFFTYALYALSFVAVVVLACLFVENNVLLTLIFALLLSFFILFSVAYWKIKYGILNRYRLFLDNLETGNREDLVCKFVGKEMAEEEDQMLDKYIFTSSGKSKEFLIHRNHSVRFIEGKKYHIEYIGDYVYRWETIE